MTEKVTPRAVAELALPILADLKKRDAQWEEDAAEWARQGYRPHYCKHGTNLWVEYDAMCHRCEESVTVYQEAVSIAGVRVRETLDRSEVVTAFLLAANAKHLRLPGQPVADLWAWVMEPVNR
jgi:hypothetical protein